MQLLVCGTCNNTVGTASDILTFEIVVAVCDDGSHITDTMDICPCCGDRDPGFTIEG